MRDLLIGGVLVILLIRAERNARRRYRSIDARLNEYSRFLFEEERHVQIGRSVEYQRLMASSGSRKAQVPDSSGAGDDTGSDVDQ
jgi:hypothetical protein